MNNTIMVSMPDCHTSIEYITKVYYSMYIYISIYIYTYRVQYL